MRLRHQLPELYGALLPSGLLNLDPAETKATCDSCAMAPGRAPRSVKHTYREDLKCCTFHPFLPNYMVGAILEREFESEAFARDEIRRKIAAREYALPIGIAAPVRYQLEFQKRRPGQFGNREDWLCPYFDRQQNRCGVWRQRGSVCTSFYCQSDRGSRGLKFWSDLENYISYVEMALLQEVLALHAFSPRQVSDQLAYLNRRQGTQLEKRSWILPERKARQLWNGFFDEQEEFYKKSYRQVQALDKVAFRELLGELGQQLATQTEKSAACFRK